LQTETTVSVFKESIKAAYKEMVYVFLY